MKMGKVKLFLYSLLIYSK